MVTKMLTNAVNTLVQDMDGMKEKLVEEIEEYDISEAEKFVSYKQGDTITPGLEESCLNYLKFYKKVCEEERFTKLMEGTYREKCAFLVFQNTHILLMKQRWFEIFDEIETNPECFERYYPMVRVRPNEYTKWIVYAYVTNEDFYRYFENKLKGV